MVSSFWPKAALRMNQLIPQNLNRPRRINRDTHSARYSLPSTCRPKAATPCGPAAARRMTLCRSC